MSDEMTYEEFVYQTNAYYEEEYCTVIAWTTGRAYGS